MNKEFDTWFWQIEDDQVRSEKFWNAVNGNKKQELYEFVQKAFEYGRKSAQTNT